MAEPFGLQLVNEGLITREALYDALRLQRAGGRLLGTCLLELGHLKRGQLLQACARLLGHPPAAPSRVLNPDPALADLWDQGLLRRFAAVPYARDEAGVYVAFANPRFISGVQALRAPLGDLAVHLRIATEPDVETALTRLFGGGPAAASPEPASPEPASPEPALPEPASPEPASPEPALPEPASPEPASPEPASPEPASPEPASPEPASPVIAEVGDRPPRILTGPQSERFWNEDEVAFSQATGFDRERTAVFRLEDLAAAHEAAKGRRAGAQGDGEPRPAATDRASVPLGPAPITPGTTPGPAPVPAPADLQPVPAPIDLEPVPAPAGDPLQPRVTERFRDDDEVAFSRATGFDRERTAVFRLEGLAEELARRDALRAAAKAAESGPEDPPAPAPEAGLPPPSGAPRLAAVAEALFQAADEDEISQQLATFLRAWFPRVLLLARHGDTLRGLRASGLGRGSGEVQAVEISAGPFERLFERGVGSYGPPPGGRELEPLYELLGSVGVHAFLLPIATRREPEWLVYADHADELARYADLHDLEVLAKEASAALDLLRAGRPG